MADARPVFFFDIDNCLYPYSSKVLEAMSRLIDQYVVGHLEVSEADAAKLRREYSTNYGLALQGLIQNHKIDPLAYNAEVDDALPLDQILSPDPKLRQLLEDIDTTKVKLWLFTNAYVNHGLRVVKILGVDDLFEGITYADYAARPLICKPNPLMYDRAMREAGISEHKHCYFVDDSEANCRGAETLGWNVVHLQEPGRDLPAQLATKAEVSCKHKIKYLSELRSVFPQFFKS